MSITPSKPPTQRCADKIGENAVINLILAHIRNVAN